MTHPTDELDPLVDVTRFDLEEHRHPSGASMDAAPGYGDWVRYGDHADAITAIRAQLAEANARADRADADLQAMTTLKENYAAMKDRAEAARAAQIEAAGWQPIETAPKNELIDIWLKEGKRWCDCYYDAICDEWRTSRPSGKLLSIKASHVSHWMPRPANPAIAAMKEGE